MKRKILAIIMSVCTLLPTLSAAVHAEDIHPYPPQRPQVGVMHVDWKDTNNVAAVRTNGTVNVLNQSNSEELLAQLSDIHDAVDIAVPSMAAGRVAVLRADGTVRLAQKDFVFSSFGDYSEVSAWSDIVDIEAGNSHFVGLKSDGTVVAYDGHNSEGQCNVSGWNHVVAITACADATFALKEDGTLYMAGHFANAAKLRQEKNLKLFAICPYAAQYIAITKDNQLTGSFSMGSYTQEEVFDAIQEQVKIEDIVDIKIANMGGGIGILDKYGNYYLVKSTYAEKPPVEKVEENIYQLVSTTFSHEYTLLTNNGEIICTSAGYTSDDWILTTNITYNGKKINADVPPYVKDGRTLAPMRAILEALGMTVSWNPDTRTVTAAADHISISISIDSNTAIVNGTEKNLDVPAEITNGRTFVPVRFFAEELQKNVDWDAYTKTVIITD